MNLVLDIKEKALQIVRTRGPLLPVQLTKELGINVMFAGALLSELVDTKVLKISNTKVGGSPVYYVMGQEAKLQSLREKLNDKQQRAFDMLKQAKVLRDTEQEPVIRVALRDIKDFAHQLQVSSNTMNEIFWKWYLLSDAEAEPIIKKSIDVIEKKQIPSVEDEVQKHLSEIEKDLKRLEEKKAALRPIEERAREHIVKRPARVHKPKEELQMPIPQVNQINIDQTDEFMVKVTDYFNQNKIEIVDLKQIRRNSDFEGIIQIPSAVGNIIYFCKAKNKQKITDSDLSLLFVQAQMKKMPILLMTTGTVTKKAQDLLTKEFKNITIKQL